MRTSRLEALPMTRDSRNDVGLSPSRIVRHANLKIESFADNKGFKKRCWTEPKPNRETCGPQDRETGGSELHFLASVFFALCSSSSSLAMWDLVMGFLCILLGEVKKKMGFHGEVMRRG